MSDFDKMLADPVVTLILIILIGAIIGWLGCIIKPIIDSAIVMMRKG